MSVRNAEKNQATAIINPKIVLVITILFAVLAPFKLTLSMYVAEGLVFELDALIWQYCSDLVSPIRFNLSVILGMLFGRILGPFIILFRFLFVYVMYRCYLFGGAKKRVLSFGVVNELVVGLPLLIGYLLSPPDLSSWRFIISVPLPILFMAGLLILVIIPPPKIPSATWE